MQTELTAAQKLDALFSADRGMPAAEWRRRFRPYFAHRGILKPWHPPLADLWRVYGPDAPLPTEHKEIGGSLENTLEAIAIMRGLYEEWLALR